MHPELSWLPTDPDWRAALAGLDGLSTEVAWQRLVKASRTRVDLLATHAIDRAGQRCFANVAPPTPDLVRLAVLSSCTADHLVPSIRVGGLRRGLWVQTYTAPFAQFKAELRNAESDLVRFRPDAVLFALDARQVTSRLSLTAKAEDTEAQLDQLVAEMLEDWQRARDLFHCSILQQAILPISPSVFGNNEHRLSSAPAAVIRSINQRLRVALDEQDGVLLAADDWCAHDGVSAWHEPALWYHAKQEIAPRVAPVYGDQVARVLAALRGRSSKCLVLDLDNTLWGGTIGDDGPQGIVLGQGSALGEAYVEFQQYARSLSERGVILAVCSKNDEAVALDNFDKHPDMVLRRSDIACFVANWNDKASNIREIANRLNIGLDAIVFVDDNPFERNLVRHELPMIAVPELPDDPALYASTIANAGYFESIALTDEDLARSRQYQSNVVREAARLGTTDMAGYLTSLQMVAKCSPFREIDLQRVVQLINKTNQFNLTTRRYTPEAIRSMLKDPNVLTLQLRLADIYGDNGIIAIVIGRFNPATSELLIDTWLMSCRVLGRTVEQATLNLVVGSAKRMAASRITGEYIATSRNSLVQDHYSTLGFLPASEREGRWTLPTGPFVTRDTFVQTEINDRG